MLSKFIELGLRAGDEEKIEGRAGELKGEFFA